MLKRLLLYAIITLTATSSANSQRWEILLDNEIRGRLSYCMSVNEGESYMGVGNSTRPGSSSNILTDRGFIIHVFPDGTYNYRHRRLEGKALKYKSVSKLNNGNYMIFGICTADTVEHDFWEYLWVEVVNENLETLSERLYRVDNEPFDGFFISKNSIRSTVDDEGNVVIATNPSYYDDIGMYGNLFEFYKFDSNGDTILKARQEYGYGPVSEPSNIMQNPNDDGYILLGEGSRYSCGCSGTPGMWWLDKDLNIKRKICFKHLTGEDIMYQADGEDRWFDNRYYMIATRKVRTTNDRPWYRKVYEIDTAGNVIRESVDLPPADTSCLTSTTKSIAYSNDSTIFVFGHINSMQFNGAIPTYITISLMDINFNLLGYKVI